MNLVKNETSLARRHSILEFEEVIRQIPGCIIGDSDVYPLKHTFADGVCIREMFIPKGYVIVGKIHKHSHANFLMKGEVIVYTENEGQQHLIAPLSMVSQPGTKRAVVALEDTVWIVVHATHETDLIKLEEYVIAKDYDTFTQYQYKKQIEADMNKLYREQKEHEAKLWYGQQLE